MFTGIIEGTGVIESLVKRRGIHRLTVRPDKNFDSTKTGDSISVNGVCLTVVDIRKDCLSFDIMEETFKTTSFCHMRPRSIVNLERALKWQSRLEGHFVLGHIDKMQKIKFIQKYPRPCLDITMSYTDGIFVVKKGSIAIDGISLTIGEVYKDAFRVYIIPHTFENTSLKYKHAGEWVNVEFDILSKYIQANKK